MVTSSYQDANLHHNVIAGRSVTGVFHFVNKTPIEWFFKKQDTVETATCESDHPYTRICVKQIIDLRITLRYLGVPLREKSCMFGDNKYAVDSSMTLQGKTHKRHVALSFHRVREAIVLGIFSCR